MRPCAVGVRARAAAVHGRAQRGVPPRSLWCGWARPMAASQACSYHALRVNWQGPAGSQFFLRAESAAELTATTEVREFTPGEFTAWLPCLIGEKYDVHVYLQSRADAHAMEIPPSAYSKLPPPPIAHGPLACVVS